MKTTDGTMVIGKIMVVRVINGFVVDGERNRNTILVIISADLPAEILFSRYIEYLRVLLASGQY